MFFVLSADPRKREMHERAEVSLADAYELEDDLRRFAMPLSPAVRERFTAIDVLLDNVFDDEESKVRSMLLEFEDMLQDKVASSP